MKRRPSFTMHSATTAEQKDAIYRFRFEVFGKEMGLLGPVELWEEESFFDPSDEQSQHYFAEENDEVVGSIRITDGEACANSEEFLSTYELKPFLDIVPADKIAVVTRLMVNSEYRGSLLSMYLIKQAAEYCLTKGIECVFIDCQPHLVPFYQRYGFRSYRTVFNDPYVGVMVPLVLIISDREQLAQVRSPFLKMIKQQRQANPDLAEKLNAPISQVPSIVTEEIQGDEFFHDAVNHYIDSSSQLGSDWGVLEGLSPEDIDTLTHGSYMMHCKQADTIIHTNHSTRTMFLVIEGTLECQVNGKPVSFVSKGGVVGEFAYLTNTLRTADVVVVSEEATLLAFEKKHINRLIESHPRLAARCLLNLSQCLSMKFINQAHPNQP